MNLNVQEKKYINFQVLLICLIPYFLVFSIFIADLFLVILNIFFLIRIYKNKKFNELNNSFVIILFFFWLFNVLNSFFSVDVYQSLKSSLFYIRFILLPSIIVYLISEDESFIKKFVIATLFLLFILGLDGLIEYSTGSNFLGYKKYETARIASLFKDEYIYGTFYLKLFFPISALIYLLFKNKNKNKYFIIFYLFTFFCIFISGDRTPLILFIISSILILILFRAKVLNKIIFSFLLIILFSVLLISNENLYNRIINKTLVEFGNEKGLVTPEADRLTYFTYKGKQINFMAQHQVYMFISVNMFKEKPFFGHGPRAFKTLSCDDKYKITQWSCSSHPHNFYLQLLSESGILGFIILFYFFCYITFILVREILSIKKKLSFELHLLIIAMFINLFPFTQTGNFFGNWNSILIYLPVGFYFGILKKNQNKKNFT